MSDIIFKRRSIRRFENKPVEQEKLDRIVRAGMQAPSAHNRQPWEFLVITDEETKKAMGKMNMQVDIDGMDARDVAEEFLRGKGMIK